jgi:sugar phosphate isomerase/epimerase
MKTIQGPGIFLAQFLGDKSPFNNLKNIAGWAASLGYKGVQIPAWDKRVWDLETAAESAAYCQDQAGMLKELDLKITELSTHLIGQCIAMHPAYDLPFAGFHPQGLKGKELTDWATKQMLLAIQASANLGLEVIPSFSGALLYPFLYPWPQRPPGLVEEAFHELGKRWMPILDDAKDKGSSIAFELHPGEDLLDGLSFERFRQVTGNHEAACLLYDPSHFVLQQLKYLGFIRIYGKLIRAFHVKDAEFNPTGKCGVYGGFASWKERAGRFRSLGDGQVDFKRIFTLLAEAGYKGWAVLEWECCVKSPEQGAAEGAPFIERHIIDVTEVAFDDFAGGKSDDETNRKILGI